MKVWISVEHTKVNLFILKITSHYPFIGEHCHNAYLEVKRICRSRFLSANTSRLNASGLAESCLT